MTEDCFTNALATTWPDAAIMIGAFFAVAWLIRGVLG
jgi:hypothetical protein